MTSLTSPPMKTNVTNSLVFYYHMYGDTIGSLKVNAVDIMANNSTELLQFSGNKGAAWIQGCVALPSNVNLKIVFEATKSVSSYLGDIAVDDISVIDVKCPGKIFRFAATSSFYRCLSAIHPFKTCIIL